MVSALPGGFNGVNYQYRQPGGGSIGIGAVANLDLQLE
jgi:hypothetical protein